MQHVLQRLNVDDAEISWSFFSYCISLTEKLLVPLLQYAQHPSKSGKEQIWTAFHSLSSIGVLRDEWISFCTAIDLQTIVIHSVLGNYIGHQVVHKVIGSQEKANVPSSVHISLSSDELAAILYISGYVI